MMAYCPLNHKQLFYFPQQRASEESTNHSLLERLLREKNDQLTSQIQIMKIHNFLRILAHRAILLSFGNVPFS